MTAEGYGIGDLETVERIVTAILADDHVAQAVACADLTPDAERVARAGASIVAGMIHAVAVRAGVDPSAAWKAQMAFVAGRREARG